MEKLIGVWNMSKLQESNGTGGWTDLTIWKNYWMHFMDDSNGSAPFEFYQPFSYTFVGPNQLKIKNQISWTDEDWTMYKIDNFTIANLDSTGLILEFVHEGKQMRQHYTRGTTPNPLSFVAKYNLLSANYFLGFIFTGYSFVTDLTACTGSPFFTYADAYEFINTMNILISPYYLPKEEEWRSIVPDNNNHVNLKQFMNSPGVSETVMIQGKTFTMISDFVTYDAGASYAIRYKGTSMVSAWKYEYISDGNNTYLKITSRNLYGQTLPYIDDVSEATFWNNNNTNDVVRYFPASGYNDGEVKEVGTNGYFLSSTPSGKGLVSLMSFGEDSAYSNYVDKDTNQYTVRLFTIKPVQ